MWPIRHFAITGIETRSWISRIFFGSAIRATPPVGADVGGHALEGHDRDGAGLLRDRGLLGGGHVHDDPALLHAGEPSLDELAAES